LNHTNPKMDEDESTKELNCIALALVAQKDMLLMHETLLLANLGL
jgi:hypothetical protein